VSLAENAAAPDGARAVAFPAVRCAVFAALVQVGNMISILMVEPTEPGIC
jgi:hypothetical protein